MAAITLKKYYTVQAYLDACTSNTVANKIQIIDHNKKQILVRGYVGQVIPESKTLYGGICWGSGNCLEEIVFEIEPIKGKTKINLLAHSQSKLNSDKIIESFWGFISPKVQDKMVATLKKKNSEKKKQEGSYRGRRMEGHKRGNKIVSGDFFDTELNNLFSLEFIKLARKLTITYR